MKSTERIYITVGTQGGGFKFRNVVTKIKVSGRERLCCPLKRGGGGDGGPRAALLYLSAVLFCMICPIPCFRNGIPLHLLRPMWVMVSLLCSHLVLRVCVYVCVCV